MYEYVEKITFINSDTSQKDIVTYHIKLFENAEDVHVHEIELRTCLFELRNVVNNVREFNSLFESHNELKDCVFIVDSMNVSA